jgi:hypothetical protein
LEHKNKELVIFAVSFLDGAQGMLKASIALTFAKILAKAPDTPKKFLISRARILFHIYITSRKSPPPFPRPLFAKDFETPAKSLGGAFRRRLYWREVYSREHAQ